MRRGKKKILLQTNAVLIVGNLIAQVDTAAVQLAGRFIWGMAAGIYTVLVPKFINETAPSELKGPFGAMSQLLVTFGIFLTALICIRLPYFTFSQADECQILQVQVSSHTYTQ